MKKKLSSFLDWLPRQGNDDAEKYLKEMVDPFARQDLGSEQAWQRDCLESNTKSNGPKQLAAISFFFFLFYYYWLRLVLL